MHLPEIDAISRRRFLSLVSASAALALGSSCSKIDRGKIVPYTRRPGRTVPGIAAFYASTFQEGLITHGVLIKTREGRPIHVEGNTEHASRGAVSLRAMGDLLGLYDPDRLAVPSHNGAPSNWPDATKALIKALADARLMEKPVLLLTGAVVSPTQRALLYDLQLVLPGLRHVAWEPVAPESEMTATRSLYGKPLISQPDISRADVVLSLQSDFLGVESNAAVCIADFAARRGISGPEQQMNRLWVIEGNMTLTGSNADHRLQARPSVIAAVALALVKLLNQELSVPLPSALTAADLGHVDIEAVAKGSGIRSSDLRLLARDLARAGQSALVIAGPSLPPETHVVSHLLNSMLGSGTALLRRGVWAPDLIGLAELRTVLEEAVQGKYSTGIFWGANPGYAFPDVSLWKKAVAKIPEKYRIGLYEDETALDCEWRLPENHWLESWGDFESPGFVGLRQPVIGTLHDSRQAEELFLTCLRGMKVQAQRSYPEYLKQRWRSNVYLPGSPVPFESYWNTALHDGGVRKGVTQFAQPVMNADAVRSALAAIRKSAAETSAIELVLTPGAAVFDGRYSNNGWLNELPDPVTKVTWANPVLISSADAQRLGLKDDDLVKIAHGNASIEAPVLVQPGQTPGVASIALGYGRRTGTVAVGIGTNVYPLIDSSLGTPYLLSGIELSRSQNRRGAIARTQEHHRMEGRNLALSWTLAEYAGRHKDDKHGHEHLTASLIPKQEFPEHKWGMAIDLSKCVGCSSCVIACQSENNIPVVGPERVLMGREMHWIRVDRYYEGDLHSPSVRHQPMMCQQCDDAPCEIVCPVNATTHSPDGINQMTYNRCVGTRYCSNNCPFKTRRFNFFDYTSMKKEPESLVHNPEVSVRPRGVMEKCTFCIQRIQNAKQDAKRESRPIADGEIKPACAAACPAGAIVFGDLKDPASRVTQLTKMDRHYRLFEELGIKPSVTYLADISNPSAARDKA